MVACARDRDTRLQRRPRLGPQPAAADRGTGARHRAHGRRGALLRRRADADRSRAQRARRRRPGLARRARPPLRRRGRPGVARAAGGGARGHVGGRRPPRATDPTSRGSRSGCARARLGVHGLLGMVEDDRYCIDVIDEINAVNARSTASRSARRGPRAELHARAVGRRARGQGRGVDGRRRQAREDRLIAATLAADVVAVARPRRCPGRLGAPRRVRIVRRRRPEDLRRQRRRLSARRAEAAALGRHDRAAPALVSPADDLVPLEPAAPDRRHARRPRRGRVLLRRASGLVRPRADRAYSRRRARRDLARATSCCTTSWSAPPVRGDPPRCCSRTAIASPSATATSRAAVTGTRTSSTA